MPPRRICGMVRIGATGVRWVCIKEPHGAEHAAEDAHLVENTVNGTAWPLSMRHYFVSADTVLDRMASAKSRTDVP